jgi:hypothetical protein
MGQGVKIGVFFCDVMERVGRLFFLATKEQFILVKILV